MPADLADRFAWAPFPATVSPWAWATYRAYGEPFFTYTRFFQYTFSWTVHHYQTGAPTAADFYTRANLPEILRVKVKALLIIAGYSARGPAGRLFVRRTVRAGAAWMPSRCSWSESLSWQRSPAWPT